MQHPRVRVVTDSTCDLSQAEIEKMGAAMVPLSVSFGPEVFYDGELSHDEYWKRARGTFWPRTSQPSAGAFERAFGAQVDAGYGVLCLTLTGHHSGTYGTAVAAARRFGDKVVLTMADGELGLVAALRSYEGALRRVRGETLALAPLEKIGVIHTRMPEIASAFADTLADMAGLDSEEIRVVEVGPVLACHAGPRVLGAFVLSRSLPD